MEFTAPPAFAATSYRISTIPVTGGVHTEVDLGELFRRLSAHPRGEIQYIEYGMNKHDLQTSGTNKRTQRASKKKPPEEKKKRFDNQLTVVFHLDQNHYNMKLFKNGNVQITGVKQIDNGRKAIDFLIDTLKELHAVEESPPPPPLLHRSDDIANVSYRVRLINSDFRVNFEIRLDRLYQVVTREYDIMCSYEPCIYPGAKIEYYYPNNGRCICEGMCNGKGAECKKITIAVFQSGCVIITGANCVEHIEAAYSFVCTMMRENISTIFRHRIKPMGSSLKPVPPPPMASTDAPLAAPC